MLGGGVGREIRRGNFADDGSDIDQRAESLPAKLAHGEVAAIKRTEQIGFDDTHMVVERNVFEPADGARAGIVYPHVNAGEFGDCRFGQLLDFAGLRNIRGHGQRTAAESLALLYKIV